MLASLAGGASCGPSNPLQQLSKTYTADRGTQQDHFAANAQAGPSGQNAFRSVGRSDTPDQTSQQQRFFQPQQPSGSASAFNLAPLHQALPQAPRQGQPPPAWAQSFMSQANAPSTSGAEQELFARAYNRPQAATAPAWAGDFQAAHAAQQQQASTAPAGPSFQNVSRLQSQGFGGAGALAMQQQRPMVNYLRGPQMAMPAAVATAEQRQDGKADWDQAFSTREQQYQQPRTLPATLDTPAHSLSEYNVHETRPLTPPLRAHSPVDESNQASRDALARTAANLLSTVRSAEEQRLRSSGTTNASSTLTEIAEDAVGAKFAQSSFMQLMRQLKDGQVAVEGDKVVDVKGKARADGWADDFQATRGGSAVSAHEAFDREEEGRANAAPLLRPGQSVASHAHDQHAWAQDQAESARLVRELQEGFQAMHGLWDDEDKARAARERAAAPAVDHGKNAFQGDGGVALAQSSWEEDFDDPSMIVGGHALGGGIARRPPVERYSAQQREWDTLQNEWDAVDATATGVKYAFAQNNPYAQGLASTSTRHHAAHGHAIDDLSAALSERHESLLQREAEVLRDPTSASAWLSLGLKQQQNEREELAIAALRRAAELDPLVSDGAAHLALAVSYTNEGRRTDAYEHLNRWIDAVAESSRAYANEIDQYRSLFGSRLPNSLQERQVYLSNLLIRLAQSRAETQSGVAGVDADVQVALGVLFNSSEEYEKASDCFEAALGVRPDDPLLFNRLGATYANSGKTDAAMQYYHAALDLDPGYVRARYNLAVASMNVGKHEDAVHHLLTSLSIQEADSELDSLQQGPPPSAESGHVSHALWDMLHVSLLQMHRSDLAPLAAAHDLRGLLQAFTHEDQ